MWYIIYIYGRIHSVFAEKFSIEKTVHSNRTWGEEKEMEQVELWSRKDKDGKKSATVDCIERVADITIRIFFL